jgi:hypothetical protein
MPPSKRLPGSDETLPQIIIEDEAFLLRTYLLRPYSQVKAQGNEEKKVLNYPLSRERNVAENAFGI